MIETRDAYLLFINGASFERVAEQRGCSVKEAEELICEYSGRLSKRPRVHHELYIDNCGSFPQNWTDTESLVTCRKCLRAIDKDKGRHS